MPEHLQGSGEGLGIVAGTSQLPCEVKPPLEFSTQVVRRDWNTSMQVLRSAGTGQLALSGLQGEAVPA